jgi:hypothetical protein
MQKTKQKGWKAVTVFIEPSLKTFLVAIANEERLSVSDVIRRALKKFADDNQVANHG